MQESRGVCTASCFLHVFLHSSMGLLWDTVPPQYPCSGVVAYDPQSLQGCVCSGTGLFLPTTSSPVPPAMCPLSSYCSVKYL